MNSPKLVAGIAVVSLLLGLTGCMGFSSGQKPGQPPTPDFSVNVNPGSATVDKGGNTTFTASVLAQGSFTGAVQLGVFGAPAGVTASLSSTTVSGTGDPQLSVTASKSATAGTYSLTLSGTSGTLTHNTTFSLVVTNTVATPDFSLSATPSTHTLVIGQSTSFSVSVAALNEFTGTVALTASGLPAGMQASFSPASISGSGTSTLNVSTNNTAVAGTYTLTIAGASGSLSHTATVSVTLTAPPPPDFSLSASPSSQTVTAGNSTSFTVSVAAINGFTGTVALGESGMPAGMLASCSPASITTSGSCTLNVSTTTSTTAGTYSLTITGSSGSLSHSATVSVTVKAVSPPPDFTLSGTPISRTVTAGNSTTFTASVGPLNGFTGTVTLAAKNLPTGVSASFVPGSITTSGSSTLTLTTLKTTATGSYTLTISGTSGSLTHTTSVSLVVSAAVTGVALNVMTFPGAVGDPWFRDVPTYLYTNSTVNGATIAIEWAGSDQGPSAGANQYDWTYPDAQIQPWIGAGKKVNLVVWANSDSANNSCGPEAQYGTSNIGNCALPTYIWTALGSANATTCVTQAGTQQMPNYFTTAFQSNYQKFIAATIQHYKNNPSVGYIRFGLGHGGESLPVAGWNDTTTACGQAYVNAWRLTVQTWESYLLTMLNYEGSLKSPVQLMVGVTPLGIPGSKVPDYEAPIAVQNHIGFGSQGLQATDVNNCPGATADWCNLFQSIYRTGSARITDGGAELPCGRMPDWLAGRSDSVRGGQSRDDLRDLLPGLADRLRPELSRLLSSLSARAADGRRSVNAAPDSRPRFVSGYAFRHSVSAA